MIGEAQQEQELIKDVSSMLGEDQRMLQKSSRGKHGQTLTHWPKGGASEHLSAAVGIVLRGTIGTASSLSTRTLWGQLEWAVALLGSLLPQPHGLRRW